MLRPEQEEEVRRVAEYLAAGHTDTGIPMLAGAMLEVVRHGKRDGVSARDAWLKSLTALGETCLVIAKREKNKYGL